jgi:hypothetical protein
LTREDLRLKLSHSTCIISIVRLFTLRSAINTTDPTWDNVPTSYWTIIELNSGILCASLPTLRPLIRKVVPGLHDHSEDPYKQSSALSAGNHYPLRGVGPRPSGSQEGLKENAVYYQANEYANHPGRTSKLTTAIHGGRPGPKGASATDDADSDSTRVGSYQQIMVTREIGFKETTDEEKRER